MTDIQHVGVVGAGLMGCGIAEVSARSGMTVSLVDADPAAAERASGSLRHSLQRAAERGKLDDVEGVMSRITVTNHLEQLASSDLVVEAIVEDESAKADLFRRLDDVVTRQDAILASNTSSIPLMKLGAVTDRPEQVLGVHFFNPVPVLPLVELVPSLLTSPDTVSRARMWVDDVLGKRSIQSQDRAGFVVNALLVPFLLSAIRMCESGFASAEDIDRGLVLGAAHPQGPLALCDLIGLDTVKAVAHSLYDEFKEPQFATPPLLARMVDAGLLGRKSGRGFFDYTTSN